MKSSEWKRYNVSELLSMERNALVGGPFGSDLVSKDYKPSGVPVIRGTNMGSGRWVSGAFVYVSEEKADSLSANCAKPGDLIFTQRGTIGQVALVPENGASRYLISQSQMKLTVDSQKADSLFLYYTFIGKQQQKYIQQNAIRTGVPHTNLSILKNTPVFLPSLGEQKRVANLLSALDAKIELNSRINAELEAMAKTLYDYWFVQFDFPDANGRPYKSSGGKMVYNKTLKREIPAGWDSGTLGDVAVNIRKPADPNACDSNTLYVGLEHIGRKQFSLWNSGVSDGVNSQKSGFEKDDFLFGKLRPYFHKVCQVPEAGICSTDILVIRAKDTELRGYVGCTIFQEDVVKFATSASGGTRMPRASWRSLSGYTLALPPKLLLADFNERIIPVWERCNLSVKETQHLTELRDWLLPMLMNGQVTVE
ncbi:restriction endonuclease subunit S [Pontiellaceae bacterium B12219]|nr:restriction endonuclease subunit S [Pontiellaceae bacterium B12219]